MTQPPAGQYKCVGKGGRTRPERFRRPARGPHETGDLSWGRKGLWTAWALIGGAVVLGIAIRGPDFYYVRGIAPWPRAWIILFFLSLWCWVGLRFIARWIWAWMVMAIAPLCLFVPLRYNLDAWWLMPLLAASAAGSVLTVVVVGWRELRRRRGGSG